MVNSKRGIIVRKGHSKHSEMICNLKYGVIITISEVQGRRARVIHPVKGWCSVRSKKGYNLIKEMVIVFFLSN